MTGRCETRWRMGRRQRREDQQKARRHRTADPDLPETPEFRQLERDQRDDWKLKTSIPGTFFFFLMMDENELDQLSEAWDRNGHSLRMRIGPRPLPVFRRCASTLHFPPTNRKTQRAPTPPVLDRLKDRDSCRSKSFCEEGNWKISGKKKKKRFLMFSSGALGRHATKWRRPHGVNRSEKVAVKRKSEGISAS